jgi:hypothetical protein
MVAFMLCPSGLSTNNGCSFRGEGPERLPAGAPVVQGPAGALVASRVTADIHRMNASGSLAFASCACSCCMHVPLTLPLSSIPAGQPSSEVVTENLANTEHWGEVQSVSEIGLDVLLQLAKHAGANAPC